MRARGLDHMILTVTDVPRTVAFYTGVLGFAAREFGAGRMALFAGNQKINLHPAEAPYAPHALTPAPGSADFCLILEQSPDKTLEELNALGVMVEEGPRPATGARGPMVSIYIRDPDGNLVELAHYPGADSG